MSELLAMFPLKMVVFPGETVNLHIFEPRYRQMVRDCLREDIHFGIPPFITKTIGTHGTEVRLVKVAKKYDNGELDIVTEGIRIFKIEEFFLKAPNKLYSAAKVSFPEKADKSDLLLNIRILELVSELYSILKIQRKLPEAPESFSTYDLAHHVGFSLEQESDFLKIGSEIERQSQMTRHLENLIPIVREMENLRLKISQNGHFKDAIPPEAYR